MRVVASYQELRPTRHFLRVLELDRFGTISGLQYDTMVRAVGCVYTTSIPIRVSALREE